MRILIVTHYFPPEIGAPQARLSEHARYWAEAGDQVTVLTGMPSHPTGIVPAAYRRKIRMVEEVDGYRVVRTWTYATPNEGMAKRTLGHVSFMVTGVLLGARRSGPADVVLVSSPTFFSIFSAWLLARFKRARFVIEVRDLWPGIFVDLGILTNRRLIGILEWLELRAYRAAEAVVVVTESFKEDLVARGVKPNKVRTIYNGVDIDRFVPEAPDPDVRRGLGATDGELLALYIGAHGLAQGLPAVVDAAERLRGEDVHFAFVGEGAVKSRLVAAARAAGLDNVTFRAGVPRDQVTALIAAADVCLVTLRETPLMATFVPSKMFELFAAGKAVVGAARGEAAALMEAAGALVVPPEDPAALAAALLELRSDPERRAEMGRAGRRFATERFDRRVLAADYRDLLAAVAAGR